MSVQAQLLALQWRQYQHDSAYHADILHLSLARRLAHMTLHHAKYTGHFLCAEEEDEDQFRTVLTDAFVIVMATANALNQNLGQALEVAGFSDEKTLLDAGRHIAAALSHDPGPGSWIGRRFAYHTAQLAKACESLDHIETYDFRPVMEEANHGLLLATLAEASVREIDLEESYTARISDISQRSIFDDFHVNQG